MALTVAHCFRGAGTGQGAAFGEAIVQIVYGYSLWQRIFGVIAIIKVSLQTPSTDAAPAAQEDKAKTNSKSRKKRAAASPSPG